MEEKNGLKDLENEFGIATVKANGTVDKEGKTDKSLYADYRAAIQPKLLPFLLKAIANMKPDERLDIKDSDIIKYLGPAFNGKAHQTITWALQYVLFDEGIHVGSGHAPDGEDTLYFCKLPPGKTLPKSQVNRVARRNARANKDDAKATTPAAEDPKEKAKMESLKRIAEGAQAGATPSSSALHTAKIAEFKRIQAEAAAAILEEEKAAKTAKLMEEKTKLEFAKHQQEEAAKQIAEAEAAIKAAEEEAAKEALQEPVQEPVKELKTLEVDDKGKVQCPYCEHKFAPGGIKQHVEKIHKDKVVEFVAEYKK